MRLTEDEEEEKEGKGEEKLEGTEKGKKGR